jgi:hypothetical protein
MNAIVVVAIIVGVFFVVGLAVGGIVVMALPMLRAWRARRNRRLDPGDHTAEPEYDHAFPDDGPRWPGDGDSGL